MKKENRAAFAVGFSVAILLIATLVISAKIGTNKEHAKEVDNCISSYDIDWNFSVPEIDYATEEV